MTPPLSGLRVLVTRSLSQASELSGRLSSMGATPIEVATIKVVEPADKGEALAAAVATLASYTWVVFASPNGARAFLAAIDEGAALIPRIACVGPGTARVVGDAGLEVELVADRFLAEGLVDVVPEPIGTEDKLLLVQAEGGRSVLLQGLTDRGWHVHRVAGYRTIDAEISGADRIVVAGADVVTFTSSSTVERFVRLIGMAAMPPVVASIGPLTSATARELGVEVNIEAPLHSLDGLIDALVRWADTRAG